MADDRTLYAGDLTTDQLGSVIRVRLNDRTVVEDELVEVRHWRERISVTAEPIEYGATPKTWLRFKSLRPSIDDFRVDGTGGFFVDHAQNVTMVTR